MTALVRITRDQTVVNAAPEDLAGASETFARQHALVLPGFLSPDLLQFCQAEIERAGFVTRVHTDLPNRPSDLVANPSSALGVLLLMLNDPALLAFARRVTGREDIQSFGGTVHRRLPSAGHDDAWHSDLGGGRIAVLSINLSRQTYEGGELQIREGADGPTVFTYTNNEPGAAVLFEVHPALKHRVTPPEGTASRTVFAGWFLPDPLREVVRY